MRKIVVSICFLLLALTNLAAQPNIGSLADIRALKEREMIVITEYPGNKVLSKKSTEEIEKIKKMYEEYNGNLKNMLETHWTIHKNFKFMTWDEFRLLNDIERKKYGVIYCITYSSSSTFDNSQGSTGMSSYLSKIGYLRFELEMIDKKEKENYYFGDMVQSFIIDKAENITIDKIKFMPPAPPFETNLPEFYPTNFSLFYAVNVASLYFNKILAGDMVSSELLTNEVTNNCMGLKQKILLIPENLIFRKLAKDKINEIYKWPFEIASEQKINKILVSEERDKYAVFVPCPYVYCSGGDIHFLWTQYFLDCSNGKILAVWLPNPLVVFFTNGFSGRGHAKLTEKSLIKLTNNFN